MSITFELIPTNGIQLHTALAGSEDGPAVILLHGFPEAWFGWEQQIAPLAEAGFRVVVPDQRGYNLSDKPQGVGNYKMSLLVDDILGLADALGFERFHLAGHNFGAMVAWHLASQYPDRLKRLVIANVPHPAVMRKFLRNNLRQMLKSWYAIFFQIPRLPESILRANNWKFLISALPGYFTDGQRQRYREAWAQPGAITGMLNWYRAFFRLNSSHARHAKIQVPTLIIWGKRDVALSYAMAPKSLAYCEDGRLVTFEDATHWVQHDKAAEVSQLLIEHFSD